jgi:N-acyl-D-aspartate/D-glutamate deacylase
MPSFRGDIGIRNGKISEIGRLRGSAARVIDAGGLAVAPGFIDTHCHYDAQVTWDPLCSFSCYHGTTTVIIGNCSLALAPVRPQARTRLTEFLSYVEAIPMQTLATVDMGWESISEYMDAIGRSLGVNVGVLIGHTPVRHYVMGDESQGRPATATEIDAMRGLVRDGMTAGALGLSITRNKGHYDPQGVNIPGVWASDDEVFALADVLAGLGTGIIQCGEGRGPELRNRLMTRLAEATGRPITYGVLAPSVRDPEQWKAHLKIVDETVRAGVRAYPMCSSKNILTRFTLRNCQEFCGVPTWHPIQTAPDDEKFRAYRDPDVRRRLHEEVIEWRNELPGIMNTFPRNWYDNMWVYKVVLPENRGLQGKSLRELAQSQGKGIIDAFLDLALEENLDTVFSRGGSGGDREINAQILTYPHAYIGLSDGGAHVQYQGGYNYSTRLLGYWVREQGIMSLEQAVRRLTFDNAMLFEIYDRGLLRPGLAADITIFDPATIDCLPDDVVHDLPGGAWRLRELAAGIQCTIVNGEVLLEEGRYTGALPGRVVRNQLYQGHMRSSQ